MEVIARESVVTDKFAHPTITADGSVRAYVEVQALTTLWLNTGTLCNLTCENCYIESSPSNDRLVYLTVSDVLGYLQEIGEHRLPVEQIGITGGEPFMNPDIIPIMEACLDRGLSLVVLTNAMRPMMKHADALLSLCERFKEQLTMRVSIDHHDKQLHQEERGVQSWRPMVKGLRWLSDHGFVLHVAGRTRWGGSEVEMREGFQRLFTELNVSVDAHDPDALTLFPEMDEHVDVPEITTACWGALNVDSNSMMCANSRMVVKRKGQTTAEVVACTLLPYQQEFSLGQRLIDALSPVNLNHPHCARFCVLSGGSCLS